jgi:hypothetical protein
VDSSKYFFGLRLNMYIATALTVVGAVWFYRSQRRPEPAAADADAAVDAPAAPESAPESSQTDAAADEVQVRDGSG